MGHKRTLAGVPQTNVRFGPIAAFRRALTKVGNFPVGDPFDFVALSYSHPVGECGEPGLS
jgi:hypothetical protein